MWAAVAEPIRWWKVSFHESDEPSSVAVKSPPARAEAFFGAGTSSRACSFANHDEMAERSHRQARPSQARVDDHVRSPANGSGPAAEIDKANKLLGSGAITQAEFDAIKAKALA
jgi:hypothetical protein